jgi:indole-3-pyruvate monooxygenase
MSDSPLLSHILVIGAGSAGLAVGACLQQAGLHSIILEQSAQVGSAWRRHYDRLHLHTDKKNSELPFVPFPKDYPRYPSRDQLIDYLEAYSKRFDLDLRFNQQVRLARRENTQWVIQTQNARYLAANLVVAAGNAHTPYLPVWKGQDSFAGKIIHSSEYKNGAQFKGQNVLVVGLGNSGGEIAIDLWEHGARPGISVRNAVNVIPRELFGMPILSIGILQSSLPAWMADAMNAPILRATIGDLTSYGLRKLPYGPMTQIQKDKHIPLIDVGTLKLIRQGQITVYPGLKEFTEKGVGFEDGKEVQFETVVLATGFRPRVNAFLEGAEGIYAEDGTPLSSGRETSLPGLYFCGYFVSPTGMLREIALEARRICVAIRDKSQ